MLDYAQEHVAAWTLALLAGTICRATGRSGWRAVGFGLMTVPLWLTLLDVLASLGPLLQGGTVLGAASTFDLSNQFIGAILRNVGYLGAGFILWATEGRWERADLRSLARELGRLVPLWRSEAASAAVGAALIPLLLLGNYVVLLLTSNVPQINNGDDSLYFTNMTLYHAVLLSAAAALGEELLFRGLLQGLLLRGFRALGRWPGAVLAIVLQAAVFGFAHAGYGNFAHVLFPALFGLLAGFLAWRFGLWSAIALHFLADFYIFGLEAGSRSAWVLGLVNAVALANLALAIFLAVQWVRHRLARRAVG
ncbi:MAG TPA: CPBP family glutamic-type intramembrane protease [Candidatus Thermoplasmatota archaeon]|nr:CPBP family glutamic-type intramembrane protease [Candidatus Thermoplasmatota archaeon]